MEEASDQAVSPDGKNVYVAGASDNDNRGNLAIFNRDPVTGALQQPGGASGCFGQQGMLSTTTCAPAYGLQGAKTVVVSPDGRFVYAAGSGYFYMQNGPSHSTTSVAIFSRDTSSGALSFIGCVSNPEPIQAAGGGGDYYDANCTPSLRELGDAVDMIVSSDGGFLYIASGDGPDGDNDGSIVVLSRNQDTGALSQLEGADGCLKWTNLNGCAYGRAMYEPKGLALSPDGKQVYLAASEGRPCCGPQNAGALVTFNRSVDSGVLTQKDGAAGCLNATSDDGDGDGPGTCGPAKALWDANRLVVSPDGRHIYVVAQGEAYDCCPAPYPVGAVSVFSRNTDNGEVSQLEGTDGCVSEDTSDGYSNPRVPGVCAAGRGIHEPTGVTVSPDGADVYVASGDHPGSGLAVFSRNTASGALTQLEGAAGCMTTGGIEFNESQTCANTNGVEGAGSVAAAPAGIRPGCVSVYVTAQDDEAIAIMSRDICSAPPTVTTGAASGIETGKATLTGTVNPNGLATGYKFQFGLTSAYGIETVPQTLPVSISASAVSATIDGLEDGRTYHYRLIAANGRGSTEGADGTFTTPSKSRVMPLALTLNGVSSSIASLDAPIAVASKAKRVYRYRFSGSLRLPQGVSRTAGCTGIVSVRIRARKQTISNRRAKLQGNCNYARRVTFQLKKRFFRAKELQVQAFFGGNDRLLPFTSKKLKVKIK
jgi:DNA-binding beta-propeller fold protein YncE